MELNHVTKLVLEILAENLRLDTCDIQGTAHPIQRNIESSYMAVPFKNNYMN
jgi:hypothetical protein